MRFGHSQSPNKLYTHAQLPIEFIFTHSCVLIDMFAHLQFFQVGHVTVVNSRSRFLSPRCRPLYSLNVYIARSSFRKVITVKEQDDIIFTRLVLLFTQKYDILRRSLRFNFCFC